MENQETSTTTTTTTLTPSQLLNIAENHLISRNFTLSREFAVKSNNHPRATQIIAISDILSTTTTTTTNLTNYYSTLQIDTFTNNLDLIRNQFKTLLLLLDPDKNNLPLANEALDLLWKAYNCLSNSNTKTHLDSQLNYYLLSTSSGENVSGAFWTFCPYCFYVYLYDNVYLGCCLRCQNETCRRPFHGISLSSLPRMDLDKGHYFTCFGFFPLGFSPDGDGDGKGKGKFESWSPIVGLFPMRRIRKTCAGRVDVVDVDVDVDDDDEELESSDVGGRSYGRGNVGDPPKMRRKSVAWNAKKSRGRGKISNDGNGMDDSDDDDDDDDDNDEGVSGFQNVNNVASGSGFVRDPDNVNFFEEDGEIFVGFGTDDNTF